MYILILTLIISGGYREGMGGVSMHEFNDYNSCKAVGSAWIENVKAHRSFVNSKEAFFTCVKVDNSLTK